MGLELLANEPETLLLSYEGLARVAPFLPRRVQVLLRAQLDVFRDEVALPVMGADSVEEGLQRLSARSDVVGAVSSSAGRVLQDSLLRSDELHTTLAALPLKLAADLRPFTLRWLGRTPALTLEGALHRNAAISAFYLLFYRQHLRTLPSGTIFSHALSLPTYASLPPLRLTADGLLLSAVVAAEEARGKPALTPASRATRGLIDELWRAVYQHERAMLRWVAECVRLTLPGHDTLTQAASELLAATQTQLDPGVHFAELRQEWHAATGHLSNPNQSIAHPAYQAIVALGWDVVPFVLGALEQGEPDFWGPALHQLTGEEPPLPEGDQGTLEGVARAWLGLARQRGWRIEGQRAG